ncbi:MAG: DUF3037 domain-containing protein [Myxococcales bacterium]|nr:DUF3037 domain-containing protein [Myxococcales bacterium]
MPARDPAGRADGRVPFDYAVVRVVPHVERGERMNAGVVLHCRAHDFLAARIALDEARLLALAPDVDLAVVRRHLLAIERVCEGAPEAGAIGALPRAERFGWLVSPRSTMLQLGRPHVGLCHAPADALVALVDKLVATPRGPKRRD